MSCNPQLETYWQAKRELESQNDFPENFRTLLNRAAENYGSQCALNCFDQEQALSFRALRDNVYRLADGLHSIGINKGSHVAVMLSNRIEHHTTWLALGVLGATMLPVNTRYTSNELDYLFNDGDAEFFITEPQFINTFQGMQQRPALLSDERVLVVNDEPLSEELATYSPWHDLQNKGMPTFNPDWEICSDQLMNIQYTSGTTGFPKGCMQTQRYWLVLGGSATHFNQDIKSILSDHPFFYMDPQWQLIMCLCSGATVYCASKLSASHFIERVNRFGIEMAFFPRPLISEIAASKGVKTPLKKIFTLGMGATAQRHVGDSLGLWPFEAFGMTEIGPGLIVPEEVSGDEAVLGTCGVAAPFREARIVRDDGSECDIDESGELWIRGDSIFKGYYNKPEANAESFCGDWFKTGDLFIKDANGYYRIVGRKKDMIRRSSENIAALEVEQALSVHPQIKQAAAIPVADDYRGEEVKVYLLLRDGETAETMPPNSVIAHCLTKLAEFKVPRFIEYVSEFPYTPSEKVAKHKLVAAKEDLRAGSWDAQQQAWL